MNILQPIKFTEKLSTKIILPMLMLLGILILAFLYLLIYANYTQNKIEKEIIGARRINELTYQLNRIRQQSQTNLLSFGYTLNESNLQIIQTNRNNVDQIIQDLKKYIETDYGLELLNEYDNSRPTLQSARQQLIEAMRQKDNNQIQKKFIIWQIQADYATAALQDLTNYNFQSLAKSELLYKDLNNQIFYNAIFFTLLTIFFIIGLFIYLHNNVTTPIKQLSLASEKFIRNDFNTSLHPKSMDELGRLTLNLNIMSSKLKKYHASLKQQVFQKEQELKRTKEFEAQKDDFMSIASHELRTPVTSLKVFVQLMQRKSTQLGHPEYSNYLTKMDDQINKFLKLIETLLDVTKIQSGKVPYTMKPFDFNQSIQNIVEVTQQIYKTHKINITGKINKPIVGDEDRLTQVINNLIINAIKYSPDADQVNIKITNNKNDFTISVQDFGIGIDKEHRTKIFDRFYRAIDRNKNTFPGMGIGLYICSQIVERHHGRIWVDSNKGIGSVFKVKLPFRSVERQSSSI